LELAYSVGNYMGRIILITALLVLLTACGGRSFIPSIQLVKKAIAVEVSQTQQALKQKLDLNFRGFEINHLSITEQEYLTIQNLPTYRFRGDYDLVFKLPKRRLSQPQKPFEVYLQLQKEGKTWRLLLPDKSNQDNPPAWRSYLVQ
jgi:hypothetical protein